MPLFDELAAWRRATAAQREAAARDLAARLPAGFAFDGIRRFALGGVAHDVAQYTAGGALFSLIPGGPATLGFDVGGWRPTPAMHESWQDMAEEYGLEESLADYVAARSARVREVALPPLLAETLHAEVGWQPIDPASEKVRALLAEHPRGVTEHADIVTRVEVAPDGRVSAWQADEDALSHALVADGFAAQGFRLPSPDEWEHLCAAGARGFFRWGDEAPMDRYPTDISPEEAEWRRQWVRAAGRLEKPAEGFASDWEFHRLPNAWGLQIAADPYKYELTAQRGLTRGGDGGCAICGGAGFLSGWLPLASAWHDPDFCEHAPGEEISLGYTVARRILPLA
ncbi:hypothetical protein [Variovorax sp.]|uniref:hypothetical protein n=1 Tax=Variovorax sp. TaxID=1871043 RepID=UPI000C50803D|nr:hypothetical protein [Variovorax sp.]MBS78139.1 hypothetical protein [Variovorax sp.]